MDLAFGRRGAVLSGLRGVMVEDSSGLLRLMDSAEARERILFLAGRREDGEGGTRARSGS